MEIQHWNDFENISESRLFYSPKLKKILGEINSDVSKYLLDLEGENIEGDITMIDINDEGQFTYNTERNFQKNWPELWDLYFNHPNPPRRNNRISDIAPEVFNDTNRGVIGFQKLIFKIYPKIHITDFSNLINQVKSKIKGENFEIRVVEGDEIKEWYKLENCSRLGNVHADGISGTLGNSCMMDKVSKFPHIFDIYTKNPEVCKLVIMLDHEGKLVARSLLWTAWTWEDKEWKQVTLQDRVYYTQDWIGVNLINWAKRKGYYHKSIYTSGGLIYKGDESVHGDKKFIVKIKKIYYRQFPYLDTFYYYNVKKGELGNFLMSGGFILTGLSGDVSSSGGITSGLVNRSRNWIRRFNEYNESGF
jgi:hypothetical protein